MACVSATGWYPLLLQRAGLFPAGSFARYTWPRHRSCVLDDVAPAPDAHSSRPCPPYALPALRPPCSLPPASTARPASPCAGAVTCLPPRPHQTIFIVGGAGKGKRAAAWLARIFFRGHESRGARPHACTMGPSWGPSCDAATASQCLESTSLTAPHYRPVPPVRGRGRMTFRLRISNIWNTPAGRQL